MARIKNLLTIDTKKKILKTLKKKGLSLCTYSMGSGLMFL